MTVDVPEPGSNDAVASKRKIEWFGLEDAVELTASGIMAPPVINPEVYKAVNTAPLSPGASTRVLFQDSKPGGLSLVLVWFGENYPLPRHTHNTDCIYYVLRGELRMGARTVPAGGGLFVPADRPYTYRAGLGGAELLEFRGTNLFDIKVLDQDVAKWQAAVAIGREMESIWRSTNPELNS